MELRFVEREVIAGQNNCSFAVYKTIKVLQFRVPIERVNLGWAEVGTKFSEWKDVPLVKGDE